MKKIVRWFLVLVCALSLFACKKTEDPNKDKDEVPAALKTAKDYLSTMYKSAAETTANDFSRVAQLTLGGVTYTVEWKVEITQGKATDVVVVKAEDGKTVTIDVNEKSEGDVTYTLTATIKDSENHELSVEWTHKVPAFKELTYAQYVQAATGDTVVIKGVVTGIISKSKGATSNCLYLQDADGAYYVYGLAEDPVAAGVQEGYTVRVSGTKDVYSGTLEVKDGVVEVLDTTVKEVAVTDYTEIFKNAEKLTDEALAGKQCLLVTIKGVELTTVNASNGYYQFKLGSLESYVRISGSSCPLTKEEQATMKANHRQGYTADVTGVICVYSGAFYLTPVTVDAISNLQLPELSDADAVAFEKEALVVDEKIVDACEKTLATKGSAYEKVAITWTSDNAQAVISEDGTKVTYTLGDKEVEVKLTATFKAGDVTETKEYTVKLASAAKDWISAAKAIEEAAKLDAASKEVSADWYYVVGEVIDDPTADYCNFNFTDGTTNIIVYGLYTADGTQRYGSKRDIAELPVKKGDTVYLYAQLQNYNGKLELVNARLQEAPKAGSCEALALTAAQAIELCAKLDAASKETSADYYWVKATIIDAPTADYCNFNFTDGTTNIIVYGLYTADGTQRYGSKRDIAELPVSEGDTVTLYTKLQNYNGKLECVSAQLKKVEAPTTPTEYTVTVTENADATVTLSAEKGVKGTEVTFTVTVAEGKELVAVKVNNAAVEATEGTYSVTLTTNTTITVETKDAGAPDPTPEHAGTEADPYTVADANLVISKLDNKVYSAQVYVKGVVTEIKAKTTYVSNVKIADAGSETTLLVYSADFTDAVKDISVGDTVTFYGFLVNYNGTYEVSNNTVDGTKINVTIVANTRGNGTVAVGEASSDKATVTLSAENGANGSQFTITVAAAEGFAVEAVKVNGKVVEANADGTYTGTIDGATVVTVSTVEAGTSQPVKAASFSYASLDNGTYTVNTYENPSDATKTLTDVTWTQGKVTVVNEQAASSTTTTNAKLADGTKVPYTNPTRIYKGQNLTVKFENMVKVVFNCNPGYSAGLTGTTMDEGVTMTADGDTVTLTFAKANEVSIKSVSAAFRIDSIDVYCMPEDVQEEPTYVAFIGEQGYETLAAAMEAATAGQTVTLLAGTYEGDITVKEGVSLVGATPELALKHTDAFVADETVNTILTGVVTVKGNEKMNLQGLVFAKQLVVAGQNNLTVSHCVFTGVVDAGVGQLTVTAKSDDMVLSYCYTNCKSTRFVYFQASSTNFTYENCSTLDAETVAVYDIVRFGVANETLMSGTITVSNSYFGKSNQAGVYARFGNATADLATYTATFVYTNNYFYQNPAAIWHRGVTLTKAVNYTVTGNTFVECGSVPSDWDVVALTNYVGSETEAASEIKVNNNAFINSFPAAGTKTDYIVKVRNAQTSGVDCSNNYFTELVNGNLQLNATGVDTVMDVTDVQYTNEALEAYIVVVDPASGVAHVYGVNLLPLVKVAVWTTGTKDAVWVTDDELENTKNALISFLADNGYLEGSYKLEFTKIVTEGNTVAQYGAATNEGNYDFIIGCGNNVNSTAGVSVKEKLNVPTTIFAGNRYVARLTDSEIAKLMFNYYKLQAEASVAA